MVSIEQGHLEWMKNLLHVHRLIRTHVNQILSVCKRQGMGVYFPQAGSHSNCGPGFQAKALHLLLGTATINSQSVIPGQASLHASSTLMLSQMYSTDLA